MNYHDIVLQKNGVGQVKAVDFYLLASAEFLSSTLRRSLSPLVARMQNSFPSERIEANREIAIHRQEHEEMAQCFINGQFEKAEEIYSGIPVDIKPVDIKRDKFILLVRIYAAAQFSEDKHFQALDDFRRYHPNDPCVDILAIDRHALSHQFAEAMACIDRLDDAIGGDPYLDVMRSNVENMRHKTQASRQFAQSAIDKDPNLIEAYLCLVRASLKDKDFDETVQHLNKMAAAFDLEFNDLAQGSAYAEFVKSPQYEEWLKSGYIRGSNVSQTN